MKRKQRNKGTKKEHMLSYEIKIVSMQECVTVVVRDCITQKDESTEHSLCIGLHVTCSQDKHGVS
jgi:hypothetical protein